MNKKRIILTLALTSISTPCIFSIATTQGQKRAQQELMQLKALYDEVTQGYDKEIIDQYEGTLQKNIQDYIIKNLDTEMSCNKNTEAIEKTLNNLLQHLLATSQPNDAYATASMIFMLNWSQLSSKAINENTSEMEKIALQEATEEIKVLVNKMFLEPLTQWLETAEKRMQASKQVNALENADIEHI